MNGFVKMKRLKGFIYSWPTLMETEYLYSWQLREILSFLANFPYHEELIILRYKYYWNRMKYWLCYNSNYNNISYASTHKRMLDANGKSLRTWRTRSVVTRKRMWFPTFRLLPTWRVEILWLVLKTRHLKLSGLTFQDLHLMVSLQTRSLRRSSSPNTMHLSVIRRFKHWRICNWWYKQASMDNTYPKTLASSSCTCPQEGMAADRRFFGWND